MEYLQQFNGVWPRIRLLLKAICEKAAKFVAPFSIFQLRRCGFGDHKEHTHRVHIKHGRRTLGHLNRSDPKRPYIGFPIVRGVVLLRRDDFGCHPIRCANKRISLRERLGNLRRHAKIGYVPCQCYIDAFSRKEREPSLMLPASVRRMLPALISRCIFRQECRNAMP